MSIRQAKTPITRIVRGRDDRAEVLDAYGIDLSCDENLSLAEACAQRGVSFEEVRHALEECDRSNDESARTHWAGESMANLAEHIIIWHHDYLRDLLPRLAALMEQVVAKHARRHPHLVELRELFTTVWHDLLNYMMREEHGLFPLVRQLDQALPTRQLPPRFRPGAVRTAIHLMKEDHQIAGQLLQRMRDLTFGFQPPPDASQCYRELMDGLAGLESDFQLHVHKEHKLLFPRVAAAETALTAG